MKAFLIDPVNQSITQVEITGSRQEIQERLLAKSLAYEDIGGSKDRLCFDEDCFILAKPGRFQLDTLAPVAGSALVVGAGKSEEEYFDATLSLDELSSRIRFL